VTADLSGEGGTWSELIGGLTGAGHVVILDGGVSGVDLRALPQLLAAGAELPGEGATAFAEAAAGLTFGEGAVSTGDLVAVGDGFRLTLAGRAALAAPTFEARGVLSLSADPPIETPFLVEGTWAAPKVRPDLGPPIPRDPSAPAEWSQPPRG
jgi:hypothetical protein